MTEIEKKDIDAMIGFLHNKINGISFTERSPFYSFTNEDIRDNFDYVNDGYTALSVLASGDQVFDLVLKGYQFIDTFDVNRLCEYQALGLKKTAIEQLSYEDFLKLYKYEDEYAQRLFRNVIEAMPEKYRTFWQNYYDAYSKMEHNGLLPLSVSPKTDHIDGYNHTRYLYKPYYYEKLKSMLPDAEINFVPTNISDFHPHQKYDLIYLSNILDYYKYKAAVKLLKSLYHWSLAYDGQIYYDGEPRFRENNVLSRHISYEGMSGFTIISKR